MPNAAIAYHVGFLQVQNDDLAVRHLAQIDKYFPHSFDVAFFDQFLPLRAGYCRRPEHLHV